MADHIEGDIKYLARIPVSSFDQLSVVYNWNHLLMAHEEGYYWLKGLSVDEMDSVEIKSITGIQRFQSKLGKLYPFQDLLPIANEPSCLWTPIKRAIHLELPSKNHNFFDLAPSIAVKITPSEETKSAHCLRCSLDNFGEYVKSTTSIRLKNLLWTVMGSDALVLGSPMLPLPGESYWNEASMIIPSGYDLEFPILSRTIDRRLNPDGRCYLLWDKDGKYMRIPKSSFVPLTRSSAASTLNTRQTLQNF